MPRITIDLPDTTFQHLRLLAEEEERDTRGQAIYLLRQVLRRRAVRGQITLDVPRPATRREPATV